MEYWLKFLYGFMKPITNKVIAMINQQVNLTRFRTCEDLDQVVVYFQFYRGPLSLS